MGEPGSRSMFSCTTEMTNGSQAANLAEERNAEALESRPRIGAAKEENNDSKACAFLKQAGAVPGLSSPRLASDKSIVFLPH